MTTKPAPTRSRRPAADLRLEVAIAAVDRLVELALTWRLTGDGHRQPDPREAWASTAEAALAAIDAVLEDLDPCEVRDAAATVRCRVGELLVGRWIAADAPERLQRARTAMGIAGGVLRPRWATVSLAHVADCLKLDRTDNLLRRLQRHGVRTAKWRGGTYVDGVALAASGVLTRQQIAVCTLTGHSPDTHFSSNGD